ncbi:MAG: hypothetical protein ABSE73_01360 [Planctomycetota bacterium]
MSSALRADTVILRDGTEYEGEILRQTNADLIFRVWWGAMKGSVRIPKSEIVDVRMKPLPPDAVIADAEALRLEAEERSLKPSPKSKTSSSQNQPGAAHNANDAFAKSDAPSRTSNLQSEIPIPPEGIRNRAGADAWVKLGEYYQRHHGYSAQAHQAYQKALLADSDDPVAREKLGYIKVGAEWLEKPKPRPATLEDDVTIGPRRDEEQASAKPEARELKPPLPVAVMPPIPLIPVYDPYGWGGSEFIFTSWPGYGGWGYPPWGGCYSPPFGWYSGHHWQGGGWGGGWNFGFRGRR